MSTCLLNLFRISAFLFLLPGLSWAQHDAGIPQMDDIESLYPGKAYYYLRPGMTGSWQVSARNATEFADRAEFDDAYARRLTFGTDVKILFETVAVVMRGTGV